MRKHRIGKQVFISLLLVTCWLSAGDSFAVGVSLKVKDSSDSNEDRNEVIIEDSNGDDQTTTTDTETEICTLTVTLKQSKVPLDSCQLEWYFLSEKTRNSKRKPEVLVFSPGKKSISWGDKIVLTETITSEPFVFNRVSRSNSTSDDAEQGDVYKGYIVLVTQKGRIIAKSSNSSRYLKTEWLIKCKKAARSLEEAY